MLTCPKCGESGSAIELLQGFLKKFIQTSEGGWVFMEERLSNKEQCFVCICGHNWRRE